MSALEADMFLAVVASAKVYDCSIFRLSELWAHDDPWSKCPRRFVGTPARF